MDNQLCQQITGGVAIVGSIAFLGTPLAYFVCAACAIIAGSITFHNAAGRGIVVRWLYGANIIAGVWSQ